MGLGTMGDLQAGRVAQVLLSPPLPGAHVEWERGRCIFVQGTSGAGGSKRKTAWAGLNLTCRSGWPGQGSSRRGGGRGQSVNLPRSRNRGESFFCLGAAKASGEGAGGSCPASLPGSWRWVGMEALHKGIWGLLEV